MTDDIIITPEQDKAIVEYWNRTPNNPPFLKDIVTHVFGRECDNRSKEARAIKHALAQHGFKARMPSELPPKFIELSEAHKTYIANNASTMNALEMARILFANSTLTNLNAETRAVNEYIKTLDTKVVLNSGEDTEDVPNGKYEPPKTFDKVLRRVNQYINMSLDKDKLSAIQKKGLDTLIGYLHTFRFLKQINNYENEDDRKSFEDAFIRYTYDKPDLSQEEVDEYIILANEVVISFKIQRRTERLQSMMDDIADSNPDNVKISMSLVEAINTAQNEYNQCVHRQQKLLDDLKEKRSSRMSKQIKDNASVLNLLQEWKNEETRKRWLKLAEIEQKAISEEVDKIASMDEIKARIFGLTKDEIKYG